MPTKYKQRQELPELQRSTWPQFSTFWTDAYNNHIGVTKTAKEMGYRGSVTWNEDVPKAAQLVANFTAAYVANSASFKLLTNTNHQMGAQMAAMQQQMEYLATALATQQANTPHSRHKPPFQSSYHSMRLQRLPKSQPPPPCSPILSTFPAATTMAAATTTTVSAAVGPARVSGTASAPTEISTRRMRWLQPEQKLLWTMQQ